MFVDVFLPSGLGTVDCSTPILRPDREPGEETGRRRWQLRREVAVLLSLNLKFMYVKRETRQLSSKQNRGANDLRKQNFIKAHACLLVECLSALP